MVTNYHARITKALNILNNAKYCVFFTGAGMSTPSGIPDFRSPGSGLWEKYDPFAVASLSAFHDHPQQFFNWIKPLYVQSKNAKPNAAHYTLVELEKQNMIHCIITQNIDGLHQKAGSKRVIELHGSVRTATCQHCGQKYDGEELLDLYISEDTLPSCKKCKQIIKPDVILYEELLPEKAWRDAESEMRKAEAVFVAGSSLETYPANTLPRIAVAHGAALVILTLSATPLDDLADVVIHADIAKTIPALL